MKKKLLIIITAAVIAVSMTATACNKNKENAELAELAKQLNEMKAQLEAAQSGNATPEEIAELEAAVAEQEQRTERKRGERGERGNRSQSSETETTAQTSTTTTPAASTTTTPTTTAPAASQSVATTAPTTTTQAANPASDFTINGTQLDKYTGTSKNVVIPNGVTGIGFFAFNDNKNITSVVIPDSVTYIGGAVRQGAFTDCTNLASVIIGNGVTSIGEKAFAYCTSLTSITLPNVTSVGTDAFAGCKNLSSVTLGKGFTGETDFLHFLSLAEINVDPANSVYSSVDGVLYNKNKTTLIKYPDKKPGAFTIADSVTTIRDRAIEQYSVTSITIPKNITSIGGKIAFNYQVAEINVDPANTAYSSENGVLYNKNKTSIIKYPPGKKESSFIIPNRVTGIGDRAFEHNVFITSIIIPNSVTSIGEFAFYDSRLTSVTIGTGVKMIGQAVFGSCHSITSVTFEGDDTSFITLNDDFATFIDFNNSKNLSQAYASGKAGTYTREKNGNIWRKQASAQQSTTQSDTERSPSKR